MTERGHPSDYSRDEYYSEGGVLRVKLEYRPSHGKCTGWIYPEPPPARQRITVGLIGEDFGTAAAPCSIDEMFRTPRFRALREWVEQFCDDWGVLTVSTGLVVSGQKAETYEGKLHERTVVNRKRWAEMVRKQVREMWPDARFIVFGSKLHLDAVRGLPRLDVLAGVPRRLHRKWILAQLGEAPSGPARFHCAWPAGGGSPPVEV